MKLKIVLQVIVLFLCVSVYGQLTELQKADGELTREFMRMVKADELIRKDSLAPLFKKHLKEVLLVPGSFDFSFDSLSKLLTIIESSDKKIRIYSWDERGVGKWRNMTSFAQYKTSKGFIHVVRLDTDEAMRNVEYTDVMIEKIHIVPIYDQPYYLTIGWGTRGKGRHHKTIQIYSIESDQLSNCNTCFKRKSYLVVKAPRGQKIDINYNSAAKSITYRKFILRNNISFYTPRGRIITWKLAGRVFTR